MAQEEEKTAPLPPKKHWLRRVLKYFFLFLIIFFLGVTGGAVWLTQAESGQQWLLKTVNGALKPEPESRSMSFQITRLSGSLPFNFEFALEGYDQDGLWLLAPQNRFTLNWRELPGLIHISSLVLQDVDIQRLPKTEPAPEPATPEKPLSLADIKKLLDDTGDFLREKHWWLPSLTIDGVQVNCILPARILPQLKDKEARLQSSLGLMLNFTGSETQLKAEAKLNNRNNEAISLNTVELAGLQLNLSLNAAPAAEGMKADSEISAQISQPILDVNGLPRDFLGERPVLNLKLDALASSKEARLALAGPNLEAGHLDIHTGANWQTGPAWAKDAIDGPLHLKLKLLAQPVDKSDPDSPLAILQAPASLGLTMAGTLPKLDAELKVACAKLTKDAHNLHDLALNVSAKDIDLPLNSIEMAALEKEHHVDIALGALLDQEKINLASEVFFRALPQQKGWQAGLNNLKLLALGLNGEARLVTDLPAGQSPQINGQLKFAINDWKAISRFTPGQKFSGDVKLDIDLKTVAAESEGLKKINQQGLINLNITDFLVQGNSEIKLKSLTGKIDLADIFDKLLVNCDLNARRINAAGLELNSAIKVNGPVKGPIVADVQTDGSVQSKIAAQWEPGKAILKNLDVKVNMSTFMTGKNLNLGLRSQKQCELNYGDNAIAVRNLDILVSPSGRLRADGGLSSEKLDFNLALDNLDFKPWQAIASQIPTGNANMKVRLQGTPHRPGGNFNVALRDIALPGAPLAPISLNLQGSIENASSGSALNARLELDPKTIKTLGGTVARVNMRLPLLFGADGIPKPNMNGNLAAQVRWDGALGPIWNLLPIPDRRLNGRLNINVDASGKLDAPQIKGGVQIEKARYEDLLLGILITDINVLVKLSEHTRLKALKDAKGALPGGLTLAMSASDGRGGSIKVDGKGALDGNDLDIKAKINHLRPLRRRDVHIELSGNAQVAGSATAPVVDGEIIVNQGEVLLNNLDIAGSVTTLPITDPAEIKKESRPAPKASASKGSGKLNIKITMLPRFTVEGRGLGSIWQAHLLVEGTPENPQITGSISAVSGNFDFLGKNFAITQGTVTFAGGSLANPLLDVELTNETPELTAHILVTGPVDKMKLTLSSEPPLPRDDILSRVLFGRSVNDLSRLEALQLAGAVAQLAGFGGGGGLLSSAKKALGVDVLRLGTSSSGAGDPDEQSVGGTTIEMGKYINDMIYMGVQQGMKADSTAFIIQLDLTPRTSLEVRTEQNNTWGGLKWKYDY